MEVIGVAPSPSRLKAVRPERPMAAGTVNDPSFTKAREGFDGAARTVSVLPLQVLFFPPICLTHCALNMILFEIIAQWPLDRSASQELIREKTKGEERHGSSHRIAGG
jgi:hypothetical protein